jgi:hypothetical protein
MRKHASTAPQKALGARRYLAQAISLSPRGDVFFCSPARVRHWHSESKSFQKPRGLQSCAEYLNTTSLNCEYHGRTSSFYASRKAKLKAANANVPASPSSTLKAKRRSRLLPCSKLKIATLDMNWETVFGACAAVADSLAALATRLTPIFGDFGMARTAARAAIEAFTNAGQ